MKPDFFFEDDSSGIVCGVDEAGRGPLAGPVVAAAVILHRNRIPKDILTEINDSKKLNAKKREYLFNKINEFAHVSVAECHAPEIDRINILQATLLAMKKAVAGLDIKPETALIDGNRPPKLECIVKTIIKGDNKSFSIAAASIIAKHHRDQLMQQYALEFPQYAWERNSGYGTALHMEAIEKHGITPYHRLSFAPVARAVA